MSPVGIERDIGSLQLEEKKLVAEIKRTAKTGNELIRLRHQISNLQGSRAHTGGIATHTQAMHANTSVATGMKSVSKAMRALNKQMNPAKQMKVMQEFQKQSAQMDMSVLDEVGVDIASQLSSVPKGRIDGKKVQADEWYAGS
ncbi:hypothetical protein ABZP36_010311 [Zizania latifolia]